MASPTVLLLALASAATAGPIEASEVAPVTQAGSGRAGATCSSRPLVEVFHSGERGYHTFRIPAVVRLPGGDLLAFAEGRLNGAGDSGDVDVVMKRSRDQGASWGPLQVLADNGPGLFGNPAPVVDRVSGAVVLVLVRQPEGCHEGQIRAGTGGYRDPYLMRSRDGGRLWEGPTSIAAIADREEWRWYAAGPCHGIQLERGEHAGRLVVPANFSTSGGPENRFLGAHLLLSDDGGRSWRVGAVGDGHVGDDDINPSETAVVELADGSLYVNTRDQHGSSEGTRAATWSVDGGASFSTPFRADLGLPGPVCQGALLHGGELGEEELILYSGPSDPGGRRRMAIRGSRDQGRSWEELLVVYPGEAAYSDLVRLEDGSFGCLFEADGYQRIVFAPFAAAEWQQGSPER